MSLKSTRQQSLQRISPTNACGPGARDSSRSDRENEGSNLEPNEGKAAKPGLSLEARFLIFVWLCGGSEQVFLTHEGKRVGIRHRDGFSLPSLASRH